ncbi:unnamed protein product, partial [Heligmosomoides polygyrus]
TYLPGAEVETKSRSGGSSKKASAANTLVRSAQHQKIPLAYLAVGARSGRARARRPPDLPAIRPVHYGGSLLALLGSQMRLLFMSLGKNAAEFFETCRRGDVDKVKGYIANKKGKKPRSPLNFLRPATPSAGWLAAFKDPSSLYTPLHYAALHGHHSVCKVLVESDRLLPSARDKRGCVPLHLAAWNGHFETVKLLAESDPDSVDAVNNAQESSLHLAAQHGHDKLVRVLLETPLDVAARTGHAVVCKILIGFCPELALQSAVDCSSTAENGRVRAQVVYPLHAAARHSHIQCLQMLRLGGFDIDFVTDEGSALHVAAMFGQVDAVKYLTEEGINPHMRDSKGRTALEVLREQEQHRTSDLTYIIQSREGWSECRKIIDDYLQRLDSDHFNSSSDSGIERRDSEKSAADDDVIGDIWRPLPYNSNVNSPRKPPDEAEPCQPSGACHITVDQVVRIATSYVFGIYVLRISTPLPVCSIYGHGDDSSIATVCSQPQGAPIHRTWNSRMYDIERGIARFPITSPMNKSRHQKSKRTSDTLPLSLSGARTGGLQQPRGSILPSDPQNCFYRAPPPVFDVWHQKFVQSDGITHTYNPAFPYDNVPKNMLTYDNAPQPGRRLTESMLPARPRIRPVLANTFAATSESPFEEQTQEMRINDSSFAALRGREDSIGLGHSPLLNSRDPSIGFACSTLGRCKSPLRRVCFLSASCFRIPLYLLGVQIAAASPDTLSAATPTGRAPLAMPEELTGSTSTSILSSSVSPERDLSDEERLAANDRSSTEFSLSTLTVNYSDGPPSPDSSRSRIFNTLISNALTLQLSSPSIGGTRLSANSSASNSSYKFEPDSATMSQWLVTSVGIPNPKAKEIGRILTRAGFDRTTQLDGCLTAREMTALGIEKHVQQQILNYLATTVKCVRPNAGSFNYVSDWLCSLELTDYLGNFVTAGLKSMLIVRTTDLTRDHLEKMGITLPGHIARILHSLMEAKIEEACHRTERLREMRQAVTSTTTSNASNILKPEPSEESPSAFEEAAVDGGETMKRNLLHGHASFSAHYLGSMEISNIDSTEESRRAMAKLKKAIREIAKVPQVFLEISIHGVRILDGKNGDVATEIIVTLGQAFELAYKLQSGVPLEEITNV